MTEATKEKQETTTVIKKKRWLKWLAWFGKFLMYGGWILIVFLVLATIILVSILTH